jgi:dephospho-CoA kinase
MRRVALTGGIATGKSYCLLRLGALGAATIDADRLAREAVAPETPGLAAVIDHFGARMLRPDGTLDRAALGRVVFADPRARAALEAIIHPDVRRRIRDWSAALPPDTRVAVADIPLLFETGQEHDFERVVVAACPREEQLHRVMARDGLPAGDARARLLAQWPIEEKVKRADDVVWTDRSFADTDRQVQELFERITRCK